MAPIHERMRIIRNEHAKENTMYRAFLNSMLNKARKDENPHTRALASFNFNSAKYNGLI